MQSIRASLLTLTASLGSVLICGAADARTIPAAAGMPTSLTAGGQSIDDFAWLSTGVSAPFATAASPRIWVIALPLDTGGTKSVVVKGTPNASLSCLLEQRGTVNSSVAIPVSSVGTNPTPTTVNVSAGNVLVVRCTFTSSSGRVLLVDYF